MTTFPCRQDCFRICNEILNIYFSAADDDDYYRIYDDKDEDDDDDDDGDDDDDDNDEVDSYSNQDNDYNR